jgi:hypothetical protein
MRWAVQLARVEVTINKNKIYSIISKQLEILRAWEENIVCLIEMGCKIVDWIHVAQPIGQWQVILSWL